MIHEISQTDSVANNWTQELRDVEVQKNRLRFRNNLRRIGSTMAYEISKTLRYTTSSTQTPLGTKEINVVNDQVVIGTILRAGIPLYEGFMDIFDEAESAFIGSYRKSNPEGDFDIKQGYITCPHLEEKVLILVDPMLATGSSYVQALEDLKDFGTPSQIHLVSIIAAPEGVQMLQDHFPNADIWVMDIDDSLSEKAYIIPGLGDAGDLAFGPKSQF